MQSVICALSIVYSGDEVAEFIIKHGVSPGYFFWGGWCGMRENESIRSGKVTNQQAVIVENNEFTNYA